MISDNGTQFTSQELENFIKTLGIKHIRNAANNQSSNGQAERYLQTVKNGLELNYCKNKTLKKRLIDFLIVCLSSDLHSSMDLKFYHVDKSYCVMIYKSRMVSTGILFVQIMLHIFFVTIMVARLPFTLNTSEKKFIHNLTVEK